MRYIKDSLELINADFNSNEEWGEDLLEYRFTFKYKQNGKVKTFISEWEVWDGQSRPYFYEAYNFGFPPEDEDELLAVLWEDLYDAFMDGQIDHKYGWKVVNE